ncbi:protein of unknown function [Actinacidiphila alni]|uniref:DUF4349 domain-containing protein n=1 Tax=Actinacidiphila alni TaxID=380248 RepID=A0A1I2E5Y7_9ACTN|nr:DUF4349 domain-containing protein [Actinacidiphila alni]SFE88352.1 protein of unknown function [Actinacidiphila alni]
MKHRPEVRRGGIRGAAGARRRRLAAVPFALLLAASVAVAGCSASDHASSDKAAAPAARGQSDTGNGDSGSESAANGSSGTDATRAPSGAPSTGKGATSGGSDRRTTPAPTYLVRTANLTVRTPTVGDALDKARAMAADAGGYAGDEDTSVDSAGHEQSTIQLRVPPAAYDGMLTRLAGLGKLLDRKVSVEDVTGQVVDVESRIKSQQASVARVRKLMDQAGSLGDVVSLESELSTREADLESLEAQQAALRARTDLATVTLRLVEPPVKPAVPKPKPVHHDGFWTQVGHALGGGWHAFYVTMRGILVVVSAALPFLLVALSVLVGYRLFRRYRPRQEPPTMAPPAWSPTRFPTQDGPAVRTGGAPPTAGAPEPPAPERPAD